MQARAIRLGPSILTADLLRLGEQIAEAEAEAAKLASKLSNEGFRAKAPANVVAAEEEVRVEGAHRGEDAEAAAVDVDAPALAGGVARPQEADVARAFAPFPGGRGAEGAGHGFAHHALVGQVLELHAHEHLASGGQAGEVHAGGVVAGLQCVRAAHAGGVGERRIERVLDPHPRRAVGAAPDQGTVGAHVADLDALFESGSGTVEGDDGRGGMDGAHRGDRRRERRSDVVAEQQERSDGGIEADRSRFARPAQLVPTLVDVHLPLRSLRCEDHTQVQASPSSGVSPTDRAVRVCPAGRVAWRTASPLTVSKRRSWCRCARCGSRPSSA